MKSLKKLIYLSVLLISINSFSQPTANEFASVVPYTGTYNNGTNQGYYSSKWNSKDLGRIASYIGVRNVRIPLYDDYFTNYGLSTEVSNIKYYLDSLGMSELTAFVGSPSSLHKDSATFFKGIYEPTWLDSSHTIINTANTFGKYLYDVVKTYGKYIRFWEVINEPDFTYSSAGWMGDNSPPTTGSWFDHNPTPDELVNLRTTVFVYNRLLRVAWEVIKTLYPKSYVCTGGISNRSFLDAMLRNTDNPIDGTVTSAYPSKAGAYFDVISYHSYPEYQLKEWSNALGKLVYFRHTDAAISRGYLRIKNWMDSLSGLYGYNGIQYPKKQFICTETAIARIGDANNYGGDTASRNYAIKAIISSYKNKILQMYWYQLGDMNNADHFSSMGHYYWFGDSSDTYKPKLTPQGIAFSTTTQLLAGKVYDSLRTVMLRLPSTMDGAAFRNPDNSYTYVLWAKTTTDLSEQVVAKYSFPFNVTLIRKEWDYSATGTQVLNSGVITLSGSPTFFEDATQALPVRLTEFSATKVSNSLIQLNWKTADETNFNHFEIQRSGNALSYSSITSVYPAGIGYPYQVTDSKPLSGYNYYRLKMIDKDGSFSYSEVVMVNIGNELAQVEVFDIVGRLIKREETTDTDRFKRDFQQSAFPSGIYIIRITVNNKVSVSKTFK